MNTEGGLTDGASVEIVARELLKCCNNWDPKARLLGNIRVEDIARVCIAAIAIKTDKPISTDFRDNQEDFSSK